MSFDPIHDLVVTGPDGTSIGYFIYPKGQTPLSLAVKAPQLTGAVLEDPSDAGSVYSVRDQGQPALVFRDWSRGAGQKSHETGDAHAARFFTAQGVDTSVKGELRLAHPAALTAATTVAGILLTALGKVWLTYTPAAADPRNTVRYWDGSAWQSVPYAGTDPTSGAFALATDGQYLYVAHGGSDGIWRVTDSDADGSFTDESLAQWSTETGITELCFSGGYMYGAKATAVGYFDETPAWNQLSPTAIGATLETTGLATAGGWVYWGTHKDGVTKLYRTQFDGTNEWFEDVCDFPTGFVATCLVGYLGHVFVGGYYQCATTNVGQGALYMVAEGTPTLLTVIGDNPDDTTDPGSVDNDNRVRAMTAAGKDLYILTTRRVVRWDLDDGGYSPVCSVPQGTASSMAWTSALSLDGTAVPVNPPWVPTGTGDVSAAGGFIIISCDVGESKIYTATLTGGDMLSNSTGWTSDLSIVPNAEGALLRFLDGTYETRLQIYDDGSRGPHQVIAIGEYIGGAWRYRSIAEFSDTAAHALRLICKGKFAAVYVDGSTEAAGSTSSLASTSSNALIIACDELYPADFYGASIDYFYISNDGSFPPGSEYAPSTVGGLAAKDSRLYAGITSVGYVITGSGYESEGWLRQSLSFCRSASLEKRFHTAIIDHDPLVAGESLACDFYIDGVLVSGLSPVTSGTMTTFVIAHSGRTIAPVISLVGPGTTSPRIHSLTVTFDFERYRVHTYVLDCRSGANAGRWSVNPETAIQHLFEMADVEGTFESRFAGTYEGVLQGVEFLEANRSTRGGIEGIVSVEVRELE